jgi:hypothetical protein
MKKSSATVFSPSMELPAITKKLTHGIVRRKANRKAGSILNTVPPPSEETIRLLNSIAREYPFCVYYKQKVNDPL